MSLNTIKAITLNLKIVQRIRLHYQNGNSMIVDNGYLGGICILVDIETGIVTCLTIDNRFRVFTYHPVTGLKIVGFQIPMWEEVKNWLSRPYQLRRNYVIHLGI